METKHELARVYASQHDGATVRDTAPAWVHVMAYHLNPANSDTTAALLRDAAATLADVDNCADWPNSTAPLADELTPHDTRTLCDWLAADYRRVRLVDFYGEGEPTHSALAAACFHDTLNKVEALAAALTARTK